jgi:periplasmic copper chaperone A
MDPATKRVMTVILAAMIAVAGALAMPSQVAGQAKVLAAADGWVKTPAAGETTAAAFALIRNPTMYDVYVTSASADVAGSVELRAAAPGTSGKAVPHITVPAYETVQLGPAGVHLLLKDLKAPLKEGDTVHLTLTTDQGVLKVAAIVRK